jgi:uncharacterized membrane protein
LLIGFITGMRSMLGIALVSWAVRLGFLDVSQTHLAFMGFHYTPWILSALALGELIVDKLPSTPSRKVAGPFVGRIVCGSLAGATIGAAMDSTLLFTLAGATGAVAGTLGCAYLRTRLAALFGRDFPAAVLEDLLALFIGALCLWQLR